jgi:amidase
MVGKTHTDELAYSLTGENVHYGTPINPRSPDRVPGGSSNGSAVAVAGGFVDFAIGSDCGGSVRIPASYCGILGVRPTHGRVPLDGTIPFASSFDVVGWFARDAETLEAVGRVLLDEESQAALPVELLVAKDAFALLETPVADALAGPVKQLGEAVGLATEVIVSPDGLRAWMECFRVLQAAEIWSNHGDWVSRAKPSLGPGIRERFEWAATIGREEVVRAKRQQDAIRERIGSLLRPGQVLCLPTSPRIAPLLSSPTDIVEDKFRYQAMCLLCIAGLGGLPQISLPLANLEGCPLGLSVLGPRGSDSQLLRLARKIMKKTVWHPSSSRPPG